VHQSIHHLPRQRTFRFSSMQPSSTPWATDCVFPLHRILARTVYSGVDFTSWVLDSWIIHRMIVYKELGPNLKSKYVLYLTPLVTRNPQVFKRVQVVLHLDLYFSSTCYCLLQGRRAEIRYKWARLCAGSRSHKRLELRRYFRTPFSRRASCT